MAKIISYNPFTLSGKLGDRVYYSKNGKNFTRSLPVRKEKLPSGPMHPQQQKFSRLSKLLMPLVPLFRSSFKRHTRFMSGYNKAISSNYHNGFMEQDPPFAFDFSNLVLGDGFIAMARFITVKSSGPGSLIFIWMGKSGGVYARSTDQLYVALFCEPLNSWFYEMNVAERYAGICTIDAPAFTGKPVHIYIGFISESGHDASESKYLGMVNV